MNRGAELGYETNRAGDSCCIVYWESTVCPFHYNARCKNVSYHCSSLLLGSAEHNWTTKATIVLRNFINLFVGQLAICVDMNWKFIAWYSNLGELLWRGNWKESAGVFSSKTPFRNPASRPVALSTESLRNNSTLLFVFNVSFVWTGIHLQTIFVQILSVTLGLYQKQHFLLKL